MDSEMEYYRAVQRLWRIAVPDLPLPTALTTIEYTKMLTAAADEIMTLRAEKTRAQFDEEHEHFTAEDAAKAALFPALPMLERMAATYQERRGVYGPSEQRFAEIMIALFPNGLTLSTRTDWLRYGLFHQLISKLSRYVQHWHDPHVDSVHDLGPYAAMLEAEDRRALHRPPFNFHVDT